MYVCPLLPNHFAEGRSGVTDGSSSKPGSYAILSVIAQSTCSHAIIEICKIVLHCRMPELCTKTTKLVCRYYDALLLNTHIDLFTYIMH